MIAGIILSNSFWALVACILSHVAVWTITVRTKPYTTQGPQLIARLSQSVLLCLLVSRCVRVHPCVHPCEARCLYFSC